MCVRITSRIIASVTLMLTLPMCTFDSSGMLCRQRASLVHTDPFSTRPSPRSVDGKPRFDGMSSDDVDAVTKKTVTLELGREDSTGQLDVGTAFDSAF